jgi:hypothetical protein
MYKYYNVFPVRFITTTSGTLNMIGMHAHIIRQTYCILEHFSHVISGRSRRVFTRGKLVVNGVTPNGEGVGEPPFLGPILDVFLPFFFSALLGQLPPFPP